MEIDISFPTSVLTIQDLKTIIRALNKAYYNNESSVRIAVAHTHTRTVVNSFLVNFDVEQKL